MKEDKKGGMISREAGEEELNLPSAFTARMQRLLTGDEYQAFLSSYERERLFSLRLNPLKTKRARAQKLLQNLCEKIAESREAGLYAAENRIVEKTPAEIREAENRPAENSQAENRPPEIPEAENRPAEKRPAENGFGETAESMDSVETAIRLRRVPWEPDGFYYPESLRPGRLPWHEAGMYYIQEASAMVPAVLCGVRPGERVLDLCAAPGGKSTKLAADLAGEGILVANEIHPGRAKILSANIERIGAGNVIVTNETPQRLASRFPVFFDRIVVDAPCSGEGMFRKEEEALLHWSPENVNMCAARQTEILEEAAAMLRPGGTLVYSTCTFSPEENEGVIYHFLTEHPDFSVVSIPDLPGVDMEKWGFERGRPEWIRTDSMDSMEAFPEKHTEVSMEASSEDQNESFMEALRGTIRLWPHRVGGEGHFAAVLKKKEKERYTSLEKSRRGGGRKNKAAETKRREAIELWRDFCRENLVSQDMTDNRPSKKPPALLKEGSRPETKPPASLKEGSRSETKPPASFGEDNPSEEKAPFFFREENLVLFGDALWAMPLPADRLNLDGLRVLRAGLHLGTLIRGRFEPAHALAMALHRQQVIRSVSLSGTEPGAYAWCRGEAISFSDLSRESTESGSTSSEDKPIGKGWCLVLIDGCAAGWGKAAGNMLKNHYPKGLRKGSWYRAEAREI